MRVFLCKCLTLESSIGMSETQQVSEHMCRFMVALEAGEQQLQEIVRRSAEKGAISGADAFLLYDTFGFPLEITIDAAAEKDIQVWSLYIPLSLLSA